MHKAPLSPAEPPSTSGRPAVLIVDGYADAADSAAALLELYGYAVCTATTAAECLARAAETRPRLVVIDPGIPGGGRDLVARLRQATGPATLAVVVHTRCTAVDDRDDRLNGGDLLLAKPADPCELVAALARLTSGPDGVDGADGVDGVDGVA